MSNHMEGISVVIPVYNKREFLPRALQSVLGQSFVNFEVILVDDGSTDGSFDALRSIQDPRVRFVRQPNQGVSAARNTGVRLASYEHVAFLDADDSWEPTFLESIAELVRLFPNAGLYATNYFVRYANEPRRPAAIVGLPRLQRRFSSTDYFRLATRGELPISASSVCIPKRILNLVGGFPGGEPMGEDQHVWWRICARYAFAFDTRCAATYHRDAEDRTCPANVPDAELPFSRRLLEELPGLELTLWQRWHAYRYMGAHLLYLARENARAGNASVASCFLQDWRTRLLPAKWITRRLQVSRAAAR